MFGRPVPIMPYRNMSIDELARHIGMDARIVRKWAERGRLPGLMVQGQWRFNRAQLLDWLQKEIHNLDHEHISNLERAMSDGNDDEVLSALLPPEAIDMNLPARSRASVLKELVGLAERTGLVYDPEGLLAAVQEREEMYSTALPNGVALPHPRRPLPYATAEPLVCVARVSAGIPFGAPDGRLTYIFFLVCSHEERQHLCVLARLAMMLSTDLPARLQEVEDPTEALAMILESEQQIIARR
jgi:PTS system nitrogen regulatory IIA component